MLKVDDDKSENGFSINDSSVSSTSGSDFIEPAVKESSVKRTTYILATAIILGVVAIWFMNKKQPPTTATAALTEEQLQIESAIAQITGIKQQTVTSMDQMLSKFYEFSDFKQVQPTSLAKDPFIIDWSGSGAVGKLGIEQAQGPSGIKALRLLGIGQTSQGNYCMINEKILYIGDKIDGMEVIEMNSKFVKLASSNSEIVLRVEDK